MQSLQEAASYTFNRVISSPVESGLLFGGGYGNGIRLFAQHPHLTPETVTDTVSSILIFTGLTIAVEGARTFIERRTSSP